MSDDPSEITESLSAAGGAVVGAALTILAGPIAGGAGGAIVARVFRRVGAEIERVILGPRQQQRVGAAAEAAAERMRDAGRPIRSDGFFDESVERESDGLELLEGVLRTAADSWESRKVPYIGRMFGTAAVDDEVTPSEASHLVRLADRLSYRQLVQLAFWAAAHNERPELLRQMEAVAQSGIPPYSVIVDELNDLARNRLLQRNPDAEASEGAPLIRQVEAFRTMGESVVIEHVVLTPLGRTLHYLMGLDQVPPEELEDIPRAFAAGE